MSPSKCEYNKGTASDYVDEGGRVYLRGWGAIQRNYRKPRSSQETALTYVKRRRRTDATAERQDLGHKTTLWRIEDRAGCLSRAFLTVTFNDPSTVKCQRNDRVYTERARRNTSSMGGFVLHDAWSQFCLSARKYRLASPHRRFSAFRVRLILKLIFRLWCSGSFWKKQNFTQILLLKL